MVYVVGRRCVSTTVPQRLEIQREAGKQELAHTGEQEIRTTWRCSCVLCLLEAEAGTVSAQRISTHTHTEACSTAFSEVSPLLYAVKQSTTGKGRQTGRKMAWILPFGRTLPAVGGRHRWDNCGDLFSRHTVKCRQKWQVRTGDVLLWQMFQKCSVQQDRARAPFTTRFPSPLSPPPLS